MNYNIKENYNKKILSLLSIIFGVLSFITAILAIWLHVFLIGIIFGIAAIVLGIISIYKENHKALGIIGISTGGICFITTIAIVIFMVLRFSLGVMNNSGNSNNYFGDSKDYYNNDEFGDNYDNNIFNGDKVDPNNNNNNLTTTKNDVIGKWINSNDGSVFDFSNGSFGIYKDKNENEDNCYKGTMNLYTLQEAYDKGIVSNIANANKNNSYLIQGTITEVKINGLDCTNKYSEKEKSILILVSFNGNSKKTVNIFDSISGTNNNFQKIN